MKLVAGIVQLLIFQQWALLTGRAKPLNPASPLCANASECNNNLTVIMTQIKLKITEMHTEATNLSLTYVNQNFPKDRENIDIMCGHESIDFPKFHVSNTSEEEKMIEMYKIFEYMTAVIGNITRDQMNLNPRAKSLHSQLNTSQAEITAIISNLSCILCRRYHITMVDVHYPASFQHKNFVKKKLGCQFLKKYNHFLSQAEKITRDWIKKTEHTQEPINERHLEAKIHYPYNGW